MKFGAYGSAGVMLALSTVGSMGVWRDQAQQLQPSRVRSALVSLKHLMFYH